MDTIQQPKVSVIIPIYNAQDTIEQCLTSVLAQTLQNIEIICIDDGSSDKSVGLLADFAREDVRIRLVRQENGGAGKARNVGLDLAKGEYLSFLDADDFFEPPMLEKAYEKAANLKADVVVFKSDQFYPDSGNFKSVQWTLRSEHMPKWEPFSPRSITGNVFRAFVGWTWDKLFRSDFVRAHNLRFQEQRTTNDMLFVFSGIVLANRIGVIEDVLAHQRRNASTSLSNTRELSWGCFHSALLALREMLKERNLLWQLEPDYVDYCLHSCLWNLDTLQGLKKMELYSKLRDEWFDELGITDAPENWFLNAKELEKYQYLLNHSLDDYKSKYLR